MQAIVFSGIILFVLIIPAIDIIDGKCVRLAQGQMDRVKIYSSSPVDIAKKFEDAGAKKIHLVDLDGAIKGEPVNLKTISNIIRKIKIPVQLGGGIRSKSAIDKVLKIGVSNIILGTSLVLQNDNFTCSVFDEYQDKIICGVDANNGKVAICGWKKITDISAISFSKKLQKYGAKRIIYTDIATDGMLCGPNFIQIKKIKEALKIPVIASGGVSSMQDIERLRKVKVEGVIVGKAIYEGKINITQMFHQ